MPKHKLATFCQAKINNLCVLLKSGNIEFLEQSKLLRICISTGSGVKLYQSSLTQTNRNKNITQKSVTHRFLDFLKKDLQSNRGNIRIC